MKSTLTHSGTGGIIATLFAALSLTCTAQTVAVDGSRDAEGYTLLHTQTTQSNWGSPNRSLANLYAKQEGGSLFYHLASKANDGAVILFLDTKPGGFNVITNNLITSGSEEGAINNLGSSSTAGLTFEAGFTADYAIRVFGSGINAFVNIYNLTTGVRTYAGNSGVDQVSSGIITDMKTIWGDYILSEYAAANLGVELKFSMAALGVPNGSQTVKATAIMVDGNSGYGSNQVLGSRVGPGDIANGLKTLNFETEANTQTLAFTVTNTDSDGDGTPDNLDTDDDNDGLADTVETNNGNYVSNTSTGTNPFIADTDSDTFPDGGEVGVGSDGLPTTPSLGYVSNPNIANYGYITIPGSFTTPPWQVDGFVGNTMVQGNTSSLITQYDWSLDFKITTVGNIEYKYAANGSYTTSWGDGGGNIISTVQATGIHTFAFNNATLARSFMRTTFPNSGAYLAAYALTAGTDADADGLNNEAEFAANTDPTNADSDGDGTGDATDAQPLIAPPVSRDIVFSVNMTVQQALGAFNTGTGSVVVKFFSGIMSGQPDLALTDGNADGIYTGTLSAISGPVGSPFGTYKFFNTTPGAPNTGYEEGFDRSFNLGAGNTPQNLEVVFFGNNSTLPSGYGTWASANAGGQTSGGDFDGDGVKNGVEYFMGQTGSTFTANPSLVGGTITWPKDPAFSGTYEVQTSNNLVNWTNVEPRPTPTPQNTIVYTPSGVAPVFVRLQVVAPAP